MSDPHAFAATGAFIAWAWRPAMVAAATIFAGFLAAAIFPKVFLARIERGASRLALASWGRPPSTSAGRRNPVAAVSQPDASSSPQAQPAPGSTPNPEALPEPAAPEPAAPEPAATASTGAAELASDRGDAPAADPVEAVGRNCKMDLATTADGLEFVIEVPGMTESDFEIRVVGDTIVVCGQSELDQTNKTYRVVEREYGPFLRFIEIGEGVALHRIQASLDRGLLTIFVPNPAVQIAKTIPINSAFYRISNGEDPSELKIDLPGVEESDIDLAVRDGVLTIGCRKGPRAAMAEGHMANRLAPGFSQSIELSPGVDTSQIRAALAKGVLTVTLPIAAGHRERIIPLDARRETPQPQATEQVLN